MTHAHVAEYHDHVGAVQALIERAGLTWVSVELGAVQLVVRLAPFRWTPETAIKKLYAAMGEQPVYCLTYNMHVRTGVETIIFTPAAEGVVQR